MALRQNVREQRFRAAAQQLDLCPAAKCESECYNNQNDKVGKKGYQNKTLEREPDGIPFTSVEGEEPRSK